MPCRRRFRNSYNTFYNAATAGRGFVQQFVAAVVYARRIYPDAMAIYRTEVGEEDGEAR